VSHYSRFSIKDNNMTLADILVEKSITLREQGSLSAARDLLEEAVAFEPEHTEGLSQLGQIYGLLEDHSAAIVCLEKVERLAPDMLEAVFTLGVEYCQIGRYQEAITRFEKLLTVRPELPVLHRWKGYALAEIGKDNEACQEYCEAIRLLPEYGEALVGLGSLLVKNCRLEEAEMHFKRAIEFDPGNSAAHNDLARIYRLQGRVTKAVFYYSKALELDPGNRLATCNVLYGKCYLDGLAPETLIEEHIRLADRHYPPAPPKDLPRRPYSVPLRIGYLSGDFRTHAVAFFLEPILAHHDPKRCKVYCYSNVNVPDKTTHRIKSLAAEWRDIYGLNASKVAELIETDQIDILVDLSGHTSGNRLDVCALKPAQVQVSWVGYPHSSGLSQIDFYLSDAWCDPPGMTDHLYRERVWRLPRIFCCYLPPMEFPAVSQAPFLTQGFITFGCFNNFAKVNDALIALWSAILEKVTGSRLCLKGVPFGDGLMRDKLLARFAAHGICPERIILAPYAATPQEHLAQYSRIDIALDTYPYHGTTTTCEALWMGVPVITLAGRSHLSRVGVSLLTCVGAPELIADSPEDYAEKAAILAQNPKHLLHLREHLRLMLAASPLMDAAGVTRDVEDAYHAMYAAHTL